jgi:hypothetical protein
VSNAEDMFVGCCLVDYGKENICVVSLAVIFES